MTPRRPARALRTAAAAAACGIALLLAGCSPTVSLEAAPGATDPLCADVVVHLPTTDACISYDDVDWVEDDSRAPDIRYTTYGRTPAVEVVIDSTQASYTALTDLSGVVAVIPQTAKCVSAQDLGDAPPPGS